MNPAELERTFSPLLITLMKGVLYQENDPALWEALLQQQPRVRETMALLGLDLMVDESEGYACLRQHLAAEGEPELPRLVPRRQLTYPVSLLLALLRKRLAEFDAISSETRLVLGRDEIVDLVRLFLPDSGNQARLVDRVESQINKIVEMGFLRRLRGRDDQYEVRRILKIFVDAQWLSDFEQRLAQYREHAGANAEREEAQ